MSYVVTVYARSPATLWSKGETRRNDVFCIARSPSFPWRWLANTWARSATRSMLPGRCYYEVTIEPVSIEG